MNPSFTPLAIVGVSCRVPGADDPSTFFEQSLRGARALTTCPADWAAQFGPSRPLRAGRLEDQPLDWKFFRLPPNQAAQMHRMERVLLQVLAGALGDAGYSPESGPGARCAMYLGATGLGVDLTIDHSLRVRSGELEQHLSHAAGGDEALVRAVREHVVSAAPPISPDSLTTTASISAGRIAGVFDTYGGHMAVDVGAASSLGALKLAAQSLAAGHCDVAVVGANSPLLSPSVFATLDARGWLAGGELYSLDERTTGTLPGEGAAALVVRRLEDALRDGQRIYAVVHSIAEESSGSQSVARLWKLTDRAARAAMDLAETEPDAVAHLEVQGCGIVPIEDEELWGVQSAYSARRDSRLTVSSAAPNSGFLHAASGMVSLVRAALSVRRGVCAPIAGLQTPRRKAAAQLEILGAPRELPAGAMVGVSSVAWGGAAFHALLGAAPEKAPARPVRRARSSQKIAIVGLGAAAPGAKDAPTLWKNVLAGTDAIRDLPSSRFEVDSFLRPLLADDALMPRLAGIAELPAPDPAELKLPPAAIQRLDRAVLLAFQAGQEALRSARYEEGAWDKRRVRVVFGQLPLREKEIDLERRFVCERYLAMAREALARSHVPAARAAEVLSALRERYLAEVVPISEDALSWFSGVACAARLAARYDFSGGAWSVDAACASSLAAVHAGALSLLHGEADVVLAGGVAWNLLPEYFVALCALGALSARGSFPFDDRADGFIPAEGAGAVVLKRLEDAEAARDRILGVIAGIGFSSDGRGHSLFAPSPVGQSRAVERAMEEAQVSPEWVDLIEAHGTGSRKADVCEASAYGSVFESRGRDNPVAVGSIKSQIGHLSSAGGMLGLIKTTYALSEQVLPPMNGGEYPNPEIGFDRLPLALNLQTRPWRLPQCGVRRAGVSAFGLGGTNYHLMLEEHDNLHLRDRRVEPSPATHPHPVPPRGLRADRWVVDLAPLSLSGVKRYELAGRKLLLLTGEASLTGAVCAALEEKGARIVPVSVEGLEDAWEVERRLQQEIEKLGGVDGIVDLAAFGPAEYFLSLGSARFGRKVKEASARWHGAARAIYRRFQDAPHRSTLFAAVTSMGGDFGFLGDGGNVLGGSTAGFLKGLKQELPNSVIKAMDFDVHAAPDEVARAVLAELEDGSDRVEVGFIAGRRFVPNMRRSNFADVEQVRRTVDPSWVLVFSGGGRGAVFEVAKGMARLGPRVVVTGRTPLPSGDEAYLSMDDEAFEAFRKEEMLRRRKVDPTLTPVRFNQVFEEFTRSRELWRNLQEAFALGLPLQYEVCDIRDPAEVQALANRIRQAYGRIDGIVHGAMLESSKSVPDKTAGGIAATLGVKVQGLVNLLEATRSDNLKLLMCFGSGAGRFGNRGQSDYCAANDLMSKCVMAFAHRAPPSMRCVTIDWTAWESVGAAVRTRHMVEGTGVSYISPAEGIFWFVNELMLGGDEREVAIFEERLFQEWPFLGASADGPSSPAVWNDRGELLVPSDYPLVELLVRKTPETVVVRRDFELRKDKFLLQHQLYGVPIVPGTFGMELLAETASLVRPELQLKRALDIEIDVPLKLFRQDPVPVEMTARVTGRSGDELIGRGGGLQHAAAGDVRPEQAKDARSRQVRARAGRDVRSR